MAESRLTVAVAAILAERHRQTIVEGYTLEHDDEHVGGEIADAAACYAASSFIKTEDGAEVWPFDGPAKFGDNTIDGKIGDLVKAGALIVAEIERLQRRREAWALKCSQARMAWEGARAEAIGRGEEPPAEPEFAAPHWAGPLP